MAHKLNLNMGQFKFSLEWIKLYFLFSERIA